MGVAPILEKFPLEDIDPSKSIIWYHKITENLPEDAESKLQGYFPFDIEIMRL